MDRTQYIQYRLKNSPDPMYEYYKEKYKGDNPLDPMTFFGALRMWPHAQEAFQRVINEYDARFELMFISDVKTGRIINIL